MSDKPKRRAPRKTQKIEPHRAILQKFHCTSVRYDFDIPLDSFKVKAFSNETDLKKGDRWTAVLPSKNQQSGYHAHFSGSIEDKGIRIGIEYWEGAEKRTPSHPPPSSEEVMKWVGSFVREPSSRATTFARFEKPSDKWRSRFNLPFKVTMAGAEVLIDGVSLVLPRNKYHAANGWLTKLENALLVNVDLVRSIEFAKFSIVDEVTSINESIKVFVEELA